MIENGSIEDRVWGNFFEAAEELCKLYEWSIGVPKGEEDDEVECIFVGSKEYARKAFGDQYMSIWNPSGPENLDV